MAVFSRAMLFAVGLWCAVGQATPVQLAGSALDTATMQSSMRAQRLAEAGRTLAGASQERTAVRDKLGRHMQSLLVSKEPGVAAASEKQKQVFGPALALIQGNSFVRSRAGGQVQVNIRTAELKQTLLDQLSYSGLEIEIADHSLRQVQGWIAVNRLEQLAELTGVRQVRVPKYGQSRRGSTKTAGDTILKADQLRAKGLTGSGIRVGIISDGANNWSNARASGDLPSTLTRYGSCSTQTGNPRQCQSGRTCNEGTAMAEIIYDMAPGAKLAVAAAGTSLEFVQRVNQLVNSFKADIIVDDLGFYGEPYFEDGDIAQAVAAVAGKVLFISSAGNSGDGHYEQNYRAVPSSSLHDFGRAQGKGEDSEMGIIIPGRGYLLMLMQWNDPFASSSNDYDLGLFDQQMNLVASSFEEQSGSGSTPFEGICYYNASSSEKLYFIVVDKFTGANKRLEMFNLSSSAQEYQHASGSIFGHPGVESVLAVGTINANDSGHNNIAFYSSRGPSRIDFPAVRNRNKPDLVGIDGVQVTGAGGFPSTFYGTSAAAPHVAAVAALLMSSSNNVRPNAVSQALKKGALDLGSKGFDSTYGYGRVDAVRALELLKTGFSISGALLLLLE